MVMALAALPAAVRVVALLVALPALLLAQADATPDDLAKDAIRSIKTALKTYDMGTVEEGLMDLDMVYDKVGAKSVKDIHKIVGQVFKTKPRTPKEAFEDTKEELIDAYYLAIGLVFEREGGDDLLKAALKQKHVAGWPAMRASLIEGLGYRRDPKLVSTFADLLDEDSGLVAAAAARALAEYAEQPLPVRRQASRELVKAWADAVEMARREVSRKKTETVARDKLDTVEGPYEMALRELTRQRHDTPEAWEEWFDTHGGGNDW
jgi:hypothetical protein